MSYFNDIYLRRLNRYGNSYQSRIQHKREREFENYLQKSVYKIDFKCNGFFYPGILEKYNQDESQTLQYLLTRRDLVLPQGSLIETKDCVNKKQYWLIYFLENISTSGYNKYVLLKVNYYFTVKDNNNKEIKIWCYLKGPMQSVVSDTIKSGALGTIYLEDFNKYLLITQKTPFIKKDLYFTLGEDWEQMSFRVTGYDTLSTPGIEFVSLDPTYKRDLSKIPEKTEEDGEYDYFWLQGVDLDG